MGLDNFIETAMNKVLKNPIVEVLRDINFSSILKQSNFKKRDIGVKPYKEQTKEIEEKYYTKKPNDFFGIAGISHVSCSS